MALSVKSENYVLHKLHSLTGIVPVGYYLVQHLMLNTFSLGGASKFNGVIAFFEGMPTHFLIAVKLVAIWIPLIFHAVYGFFIVGRAKFNYGEKAFSFKENRYFTLQRISGIVAFAFLAYHMTTTSVMSKIKGTELIEYGAWAGKLSSFGYLILVVYMIGVLTSAYHFSYGIWSFCIRWGITISDRAQANVWKVANVAFVGITLMGWVALAGFFYAPFAPKEAKTETPITASAPGSTIPASFSR